MFNWFKKTEPAPQTAPKSVSSFFSTHAFDGKKPSIAHVADILAALPRPESAAEYAQDDSSNGILTNKLFDATSGTINDALVMWYASQSFIGHQLCAMVSQHWLVNKACTMPAKDALRDGYNILSIDGDDLDTETVRLMKQYDKRFNVSKQLIQFIRKGRIFGIRIALFKVESTDPEYYEKPFNIDGVTPNSYKGIVQVDPYWCAPMLDEASASQPDSLHFYEPTWWIINGRKYHRSHLVIYRHDDPMDILKPQYIYGGVPLAQQIMERIYASERTANEAPQLAMTKRTNVWLTDMSKFMAKGDDAVNALNQWSFYRDNYGIKLGDKEGDEFQQHDTALSELDAVIMSQYQLVASIAGVPATKLLGTQPKGFNSTGDYEESSYHEELESIQYHDLTPFLERHHALVMKAYIMPKLNTPFIETSVAWPAMDSPTALELAQANLVKAQTGAALIESGALSSEEERQRITSDKDSGYHELGLSDEAPDVPDDEEETDQE